MFEPHPHHPETYVQFDELDLESIAVFAELDVDRAIGHCELGPAHLYTHLIDNELLVHLLENLEGAADNPLLDGSSIEERTRLLDNVSWLRTRIAAYIQDKDNNA